ncbi:hypothetical protein QA601_10520 [Chitinispirillales bacterium ANBcel5]|nr:hypothetical protein [Chitinispirillales bacterium ANBcel5]
MDGFVVTGFMVRAKVPEKQGQNNVATPVESIATNHLRLKLT